MTETWRIIYSGFSRGAWNMALDEALLASVGSQQSVPVLRLYGWQPAALSLGYAQPSTDVDLVQLQQNGWDLVRRPTGGRAILHIDELTYSLTAPLVYASLAGGVLESYKVISSALLRALNTLGIAACGEKEYLSDTGHHDNNPVCFERPSNYEITVNGKKIIGSAQARKFGGLLQHGTLPLSGDLTRITNALNYSSIPDRLTAGYQLLKRAVTMESLLGRIVPWQEAADAFAIAFAETFSVQMQPSEPSVGESAHAIELERTKYSQVDWTFRI